MDTSSFSFTQSRDLQDIYIKKQKMVLCSQTDLDLGPSLAAYQLDGFVQIFLQLNEIMQGKVLGAGPLLFQDCILSRGG